MPVKGRGWHMGINSQLCLAAWMPATWATASTSPFFRVPFLIWTIVSGDTRISPAATARRWVTAFSVTSTIRARPCLLKWVSSPMVQPPISFMVRGVSLACSVRWCPLGFCRMPRRMASSNSLP